MKKFGLIALAVIGAIALYQFFSPKSPAPYSFEGGPTSSWPVYGKSDGGDRYSPLDQINRGNVSSLEIAWEYHTTDVAFGEDGRQKTTFQATPIVVDGLLYVSTVYGRVVALNPETGQEVWNFDPEIDRSFWRGEFASRGVAYWKDKERQETGPCTRRVFIANIDAKLMGLDAATGKPCTGFGVAGVVDLSRGVRFRDLSRNKFKNYGVTSPPVIIGDLVVVGSAIGDNGAVEMERGLVRAFDARSGLLRWLFDPIPQDKESRAWKEWRPDQAKRTGAANVWAQIAVDAERDLVFVPTSSPSPDYYGGERLGNNRYADSVVALRGSTGEVVWDCQIVHHNLWDYDLGSQPTLVTVRKGGREIPAVAQATKMGFLFLLDRETGQPIFPVEERAVPKSDIPGEQSWPTQPFPTQPAPLAPLSLGPDDAWGLTFWDRGKCRDLIAGLNNQGIFTPPAFEETLIYPGIMGGANWGSVAFEPARGVVLLNLSRLPFIVKLVPRKDYLTGRANRKKHEEYAPQEGTPVGMVRRPLVSPLDLPCIKPPWGTLLAVELESGQVKWEVPLGTIRDIAPIPLPLKYGTPNLGGPIVTAGGLVFIGAAMDDYLRAFDLDSGEELWKGRLPAGGQATPMTYRLKEGGRQFVVIAAGGHGRLGTTAGDSLVAFALPPKNNGPYLARG